MLDKCLIDQDTPQYKGCVHMHTDRSPDSKCPPEQALAEYRNKGYHFCVVTDHEVYWNSENMDCENFLVLAGAESAFVHNEAHPFSLNKAREKHCHLNLIWDVTKGDCSFQHNEVLPRPMDWGISSWNRCIASYREKSQLVIFNHPNWSHTDYEMLLATEGCFAFEIWNTGSVKDVGGYPDDAIWDYCLERGKRIWAVAGDDTHRYGPEWSICGTAATIVCAEEFSRAGLIGALKAGLFYASTGPEIHAMRIEDGVLRMQFSRAALVQIVGGCGFGTSLYAREDIPLESLEWPVNPHLNYFRVRIIDAAGRIAWSQPVFLEDLLCMN
jgi:hypothetical protein